MTEGKITFDGYQVKEINFLLNQNYSTESEQIEINFELESKQGLAEDKMHSSLLLTAKIFDDAEKNNYPFQLKVELEGFFSIDSEKEIDIEKYSPNMIAILYPYLRALISNITVNSNIPALTLPTINANDFIKNN